MDWLKQAASVSSHSVQLVEYRPTYDPGLRPQQRERNSTSGRQGWGVGSGTFLRIGACGNTPLPRR